MSNCEVVTFPLVSLVRCGALLYQFLIFALFPILTKDWTIHVSFISYFFYNNENHFDPVISIQSVPILPVDFCISVKSGHSVLTFIISSH